MEYREFDQLGIKTSLLGFGCMRFPTLKNGNIDEAESEKMLDEAYRNGVNYFDTAYPYHNGDSEPFVGRALNKYDRSSYYLATKLPCWLVNKKEDVRRIFTEQLKRLDKDYVDFFLLHALSRDSWRKMLSLGVLEVCEELKAEGRIRYFGFSFHDEYSAFEEIVTYRKWDFCQIQLNYKDIEEQAGMKGYEIATKLGIPLVIMEPVKGSNLANYPDEITDVFKKIHPDKSTASWALRWVGTLPNAKVILSGMSNMEQVLDNIHTFSPFTPLNTEEQTAVAEVTEMLNKRVNNGCTGCRYCMPCPAGVDIPGSFSLWNTYGVFRNAGNVYWTWEHDITAATQPKNCVKCGICETKCPQKINIRKDLEAVQVEMDTVFAGKDK